MTGYMGNEVLIITLFETSLFCCHAFEIWLLHMLCKRIELMYNMDGSLSAYRMLCVLNLGRNSVAFVTLLELVRQNYISLVSAVKDKPTELCFTPYFMLSHNTNSTVNATVIY
jgi:hypothetical protein